MTIPSPPSLTDLAYRVPSAYVNKTHIAYINGVFRVTFLEEHLGPSPEGDPREVHHIVVPRCAVTMTPASVADHLRALGELYNKVAEAARGAAAAEVADEGSTMQ